ncbi:MAG: DUF1028 domain-containing protein [Candidatus Thorarchaeota archaeon]
MTFSIVAFDKNKKEIGFAIASCCWNAGLVCNATEKGAIAHQAKGNTKYHPTFFQKLAEKMTLEEILQYFKSIDENIETRQIGMISFDEEKALSFTGKECSIWAEHKIGRDYACQGNTLVSSDVITQMSIAFEAKDGSLTERLYEALLAGEAVGGDARGKQAARLCVKKVNEKADNQIITIVDFNIEDHEEPVKEIGRLLSIRENYRKLSLMGQELEQVDTDEERSIILMKAQEFLEDKKEPRYLDMWSTLGYMNYSLGKIESAFYCFKTLLEISPTILDVFMIEAKTSGLSEEFIKSLIE